MGQVLHGRATTTELAAEIDDLCRLVILQHARDRSGGGIEILRLVQSWVMP